MKFFQNKIQGAKTFSTVVLSLSMFYSCTTVEHDFGIDLIPDKDLIEIASKVLKNVKTYTIETDSIPTDKWGFTYLGSTVMSEFGAVDASFATTYLVKGFKSIDSLWGDEPKIDSVVLIYSSSYEYGDTLNSEPTIITVRELDKKYFDKKMIDSSVYFSNFKMKPLLSEDVLTSFKLERNEFVKRTHLPIKFAEQFLDTTGGIYSGADSLFVQKFHGLHFESTLSSSRGVMRRTSLSNTQVAIYYHNKNKPEADTTSVGVFLNNKNADGQETFNQYVTMIDNRYELADPIVGVKISDIGDVLNTQKKVYIGGVSGVLGLLEFPKDEILELKAEAKERGFSLVAINNASIKFNVNNPSAVNLDKAFSHLVLMDDIHKQFKNYNSQRYFTHISGTPIIDNNPFMNNTTFGGNMNRSTNSYTMNITRYIQNILSYDENDTENSEDDKPNYKIQLLPKSELELTQAFKSLVLDGGGVNGSAEIELTYTFLK